jgi:hypothetical protein
VVIAQLHCELVESWPKVKQAVMPTMRLLRAKYLKLHSQRLQHHPLHTNNFRFMFLGTRLLLKCEDALHDSFTPFRLALNPTVRSFALTDFAHDSGDKVLTRHSLDRRGGVGGGGDCASTIKPRTGVQQVAHASPAQPSSFRRCSTLQKIEEDPSRIM